MFAGMCIKVPESSEEPMIGIPGSDSCKIGSKNIVHTAVNGKAQVATQKPRCWGHQGHGLSTVEDALSISD